MQGGKSGETKTYQVWALESEDTDTATQLHHHALSSNTINKTGVRQEGTTVGVALSCTMYFYNDFFGEGHCAGQKEADCAEMTISTQTDLELCLSSEEEEDGEIGVLAILHMSL